MLTCDHYLLPTSLDEAFDQIAANAGRFRLVAGATDLLPWARQGRAGDVHQPVLIDVTNIPELLGWEMKNARVRLGAALPIERLLDDRRLAQELPCMPRCAAWFADSQIRELATIGGNVVNASPAGDCLPPLMALDATLRLARRIDGAVRIRELPLSQFITGPGRTLIEDGEILLSIECDSARGYGASFEKVGHRRSLVISVVCACALVKLSPEGHRFADVRLGVGGVGPVPLRLVEVEAALRGGEISPEALEKVAATLPDLVQSRSRRAYRREVLRAFVRNSLTAALDDLDRAQAA